MSCESGEIRYIRGKCGEVHRKKIDQWFLMSKYVLDGKKKEMENVSKLL